MELVDRYLQAVKFWLPKKQKQDIVAELSEDLHSQIEEKESQLGRKLTGSEIEEILKQRGRPVLVANRYTPQQFLIGPVLYPIYVFVLKIVALCYLLPWVLVWIGIMTYSLTYRTQHGGWVGAIGSAWAALWTLTFIVLGIVTIVFAVLERVQAKSHFMENWDPRKLPPLRNPYQIKRFASLVEIAANFVFGIFWWIAYFSTPLIVDRREIRILLASDWVYFFWGFLCVTIAHVVLSAYNLAYPYWTVRRATFRLLTNLLGSGLFCLLMKANIFAQVMLPGIAIERTVEITNMINFWAGRMFPFAILVAIAVAAGDLYRIFRIRNQGAPISHGVATAVV
jgi:hypothetical protein